MVYRVVVRVPRLPLTVPVLLLALLSVAVLRVAALRVALLRLVAGVAVALLRLVAGAAVALLRLVAGVAVVLRLLEALLRLLLTAERVGAVLLRVASLRLSPVVLPVSDTVLVFSLLALSAWAAASSPPLPLVPLSLFSP